MVRSAGGLPLSSGLRAPPSLPPFFHLCRCPHSWPPRLTTQSTHPDRGHLAPEYNRGCLWPGGLLRDSQSRHAPRWLSGSQEQHLLSGGPRVGEGPTALLLTPQLPRAPRAPKMVQTHLRLCSLSAWHPGLSLGHGSCQEWVSAARLCHFRASQVLTAFLGIKENW